MTRTGGGGESTLGQRNQEAASARRGMAPMARALVCDGESILLDAGSSVAALATELQHVVSLTATTTSLAVLEELADVETIHVEYLGGTLRHPSQGFVGPLAEAALERTIFDWVFLGADGVAQDSICEADLQQTRLKEMMCRQARDVVVLAYASKLGADPFNVWAQLPERWTLVTDDSVTEEQLELFYVPGPR